jgi:hypothetical protein
MDGEMVEVGGRYLFRYRRRQVPVELKSKDRGADGRRRYVMVSLLDGTVFERLSARALSKHYDSCALATRVPDCNCSRVLSMVVRRGQK